MAPIHQQELYAHGRLSGACLARRSDPHAGRESAAWGRPAAHQRRSTAESNRHCRCQYAVGSAAGHLDDTPRVPESGHEEQRDREVSDNRWEEIHRRDVHRPEQGAGERLHQRAESGRTSRDLDRQRHARRHAVRSDLHRLQRLRRRQSSRPKSCRSRAASRRSI